MYRSDSPHANAATISSVWSARTFSAGMTDSETHRAFFVLLAFGKGQAGASQRKNDRQDRYQLQSIYAPRRSRLNQAPDEERVVREELSRRGLKERSRCRKGKSKP